jgi:hypothetical protein
MFNTKSIPSKSKYIVLPTKVKEDPFKEIFDLWLQLTPEEKVKLSDKKIKWYNQQANNK